VSSAGQIATAAAHAKNTRTNGARVHRFARMKTPGEFAKDWRRHCIERVIDLHFWPHGCLFALAPIGLAIVLLLRSVGGLRSQPTPVIVLVYCIIPASSWRPSWRRFRSFGGNVAEDQSIFWPNSIHGRVQFGQNVARLSGGPNVALVPCSQRTQCS